MVYRGHVENGVIRLEGTAVLPDGTPVRIEIDRGDGGSPRAATIEELARAQGVLPCADPRDLARDWPEDESLDDFLAFIRQSRA